MSRIRAYFINKIKHCRDVQNQRGHAHRVTLDNDVRIAYRYRDRAPRISCDVAPLARTRARLEPERAVHPERTDRGHMRAAVLVDGRKPGRAGVLRVRSGRRPRIEPRSATVVSAAEPDGLTRFRF